MRNDSPVGVFDSGIGGLTVVREMLGKMPGEGIVYLGDTARVPYGTRSPETVRRYALEGVDFLLSKGIKHLVVACNTVSAVGLEAIREKTPVPLTGVIEPGARAAVESAPNKKVGVIGTEATIRSGAYLRSIKAADNGVEVYSAACPLFVPLVEEGWLEGDVPALVAGEYLRGMKHGGIDALVLGCTHYPLLKPVISMVMGDGIKLVDSAAETARQVDEELRKSGNMSASGGNPLREFYVTDSPEKFRSLGERFLGRSIEGIEKVELEVYDEGRRQAPR
jgi:glutamate racemase